MRGLVGMFLLLVASVVARVGSAAEPDGVLVAPFLSVDGAVDTLSPTIVEALQGEFDPIGIDAAEPLEDYSARVYLLACPSGEYLGCVFVIAERSDAAWAIAGSVAPGIEGVEATVQFIDVADSSVVFSLTVPMPDEESKDAVLHVLVSTLRWVVDGGVEDGDLRGTLEDARVDWEEGRRDAAQAALDLIGLEQELGEMEFGGRVELDRPDLTEADLAALAGDAVVTPWDRLGMGEEEFLRYQNSGLTEEQWRARTLGRQKTLRVRLGGGGGYGPYASSFDGRYARDGVTTEVIEKASLQELVPAIGAIGRLEVGFGVHSFVEVALSLELRPSFVRHAFQQEYVGDAYPLDLGKNQLGTLSTSVGGHVLLVGRPSYAFRPLVSVGMARWGGPATESTIEVPEEILTLKAPSAFLVELAPGFEADVAPAVALFARGVLALSPGDGEWLAQEGGSGLSSLPTSKPGPAFGVTAYVGVQLRAGPFGGVESSAGFDDDFGDF